METSKVFYSPYRKAKPASAVSMHSLFTGGVPLTMATLLAFLGVYKAQPILGFFNQLRHNFMEWMIECKHENVVPHVYINVSGPCVNWYRSDDGQLIFRTTVHTDNFIQKTVYFAASFGVIIDNAWQSEYGWWFDVDTYFTAEVNLAIDAINEKRFSHA